MKTDKNVYTECVAKPDTIQFNTCRKEDMNILYFTCPVCNKVNEVETFQVVDDKDFTIVLNSKKGCANIYFNCKCKAQWRFGLKKEEQK